MTSMMGFVHALEFYDPKEVVLKVANKDSSLILKEINSQDPLNPSPTAKKLDRMSASQKARMDPNKRRELWSDPSWAVTLLIRQLSGTSAKFDDKELAELAREFPMAIFALSGLGDKLTPETYSNLDSIDKKILEAAVKNSPPKLAQAFSKSLKALQRIKRPKKGPNLNSIEELQKMSWDDLSPEQKKIFESMKKMVGDGRINLQDFLGRN